MSNICQHILCGAILLGIASENPAAAQEMPPANSPVQIYFTAMRQEVYPAVPTLSHLRASIDKKPAQVASLRSANGDKLLFAVLVDISGSDAPVAAQVKEMALQLFRGLLAEGDKGYLVLFNEQIAMSDKTVQLPEVERKLESAQFQGGTAIFDAIADTCTKLLSKSGNPDTPRRVIFLITDGTDNSSKTNDARAVSVAAGEGVAIFPLQTVSKGMSMAESRHAVDFLLEASDETGGQAFRATEAVKGASLLLRAIHEQWVLGVVPPQAPDQKLHSLSIKSSEKNVRVSAPGKILLR